MNTVGNKLADEATESNNESQAQSEIDNLSPDLKEVAVKYLSPGYRVPPSMALHEAQAQREIDNLPPNLQEVAKKYLGPGYGVPPSTALYEAQAQGRINNLPGELKASAEDAIVVRGNLPSVALAHALEYGRLLRKIEAMNQD